MSVNHGLVSTARFVIFTSGTSSNNQHFLPLLILHRLAHIVPGLGSVRLKERPCFRHCVPESMRTKTEKGKTDSPSTGPLSVSTTMSSDHNYTHCDRLRRAKKWYRRHRLTGPCFMHDRNGPRDWVVDRRSIAPRHRSQDAYDYAV